MLISIILVIAIIVFARKMYLKSKGIVPKKIINITHTENIGLKLVCFIIPLVGLIIYAVNITQNPEIAIECGKWSLAGAFIGLLLIGVIIVCML